MKLLMVIVNEEDKDELSAAFQEAGVFATIVATTGEFLQYGNTTFLVGVESKKIEQTLSVIDNHTQKRSVHLKNLKHHEPILMNSGKATIFLLNVNRFEKIKVDE